MYQPYENDELNIMISEDEAYIRRRRSRQRHMAEKRRRLRRKRFITRVILCLVVIITAIVIIHNTRNKNHSLETTSSGSTPESSITAITIEDTAGSYADDISTTEPETSPPPADYPYSDLNASVIKTFKSGSDIKSIDSDQVISESAILVDCDKDSILADRGGTVRINPASMTKVLTVLTAALHLESEASLDDKVRISQATTDFIFKNDCSAVNFSVDEEVTVRDLFYGTILPSGADAALELAIYISGSHEAFVDLMNDTIRDLGLSDTAHFTNCIGLYGDDHYCSLRDMAIMLDAAMNNELCRRVLSERKYSTSSSAEHPEGIEISNWFLRRIDDKDCMGSVLGAKTGFVNESGNCAASYYTSDDGRTLICVTAGGTSSWRTIYDHVAIYNIYGNGNTGYVRGS